MSLADFDSDDKEGFSNEILDSLHREVHPKDWIAGINLYQNNDVSTRSSYQGLYLGEINNSLRTKFEVRLRLRQEMLHIQWVECSCSKYRKHGHYCEHIVAFVLYLSETESRLFSKLSFRAKGAKKTKKVSPSNISASHSFLSHLTGEISKVTIKGNSFTLSIEDKRGHQTAHITEVDSLANYLAGDIKKPKVMRTKKYQHNRQTLTLGLSLTEPRTNFLIIQKAAAITRQSDTATKVKFYLEDDCMLGEEFLYHKKEGFFKLDNPELLKELKRLPLKRSIKDEEIPLFLKKNMKSSSQATHYGLLRN